MYVVVTSLKKRANFYSLGLDKSHSWICASFSNFFKSVSTSLQSIFFEELVHLEVDFFIFLQESVNSSS